MTELIERLRIRERAEHPASHAKDCKDAADKIEGLRDALREVRPFVLSDIASMENQVASDRRSTNDIVLDEIRKLLARVDAALNLET